MAADKDAEGNLVIGELEHYSALIRFYFGIDPETLDDDEFFRLWGQLEFALRFESKLKRREIKIG